jgi:hypothetical protein
VKTRPREFLFNQAPLANLVASVLAEPLDHREITVTNVNVVFAVAFTADGVFAELAVAVYTLSQAVVEPWPVILVVEPHIAGTLQTWDIVLYPVPGLYPMVPKDLPHPSLN